MTHPENPNNPILPLRNEPPSTLSVWTSPYLQAATSDNTRRAYQADIRHFERWGGLLPTTTETLMMYLQAFAAHLNPRTLARRLTALKHWHTYQGFLDPTSHPAVGKMLAGIHRTHGKPKDKASPLLPEHLQRIVTYLLEDNTLLALRDNALLQLAFFGAFRRSEIVALCVEHIQWQPKGLEILIPHSKTDPLHEGQYCAIPYGTTALCPVTALHTWLHRSHITEGAIFRGIRNKDGTLDERPLHPAHVNHILKKRARQAGLSSLPLISSHSLRRGLATSASRDGASLSAIMRQGRWKHVNTVMEYIEAAERFEDNAALNIMQTMARKNDNNP